MPQEINQFARRFALSAAVLSGALLLGGCPQTLDPTDETLPATTLGPGVYQTQLLPGRTSQFAVELPAGESLEFVARPDEAASAGLRFAVDPTGAVFTAKMGDNKKSSDARFQVAPRSGDEDGAVGFRFVGRAADEGRWRLAMTVARDDLQADFYEAARRKSWLEQGALIGYILAGRPAIDGWFADFLDWSFPGLSALSDPVAVTLGVKVAPDGDIADNADPNSGDANDPNSGGGGGDGNTPVTPAPARFLVQEIARTGDAVPDQSGATFTYFSNPVIDSEGRVAFYAGYQGGVGTSGLYVYDGGELTRVFDTDPNHAGVVPGYGAGDYFGDFDVAWDSGSPHMSWGGGGRLIFVSHISGSDLANGVFRWRASDSDLLLVADGQDISPNFSDYSGVADEFLPEFFHPQVTDSGQVLFTCRYSYFRTDREFVFFNIGLFVSNGRTVTPIVVQNQGSAGEVPGNFNTATFDRVEPLPAVSPSGDLIFQSSIEESVGDFGVYATTRSGNTSRILDNAEGRSFTGLTLGSQIGVTGEPYDAIAVGRDTRIAVQTTLTTNAGASRDIVALRQNSVWNELQGQDGTRLDTLLSGVNNNGMVLGLANGAPNIANTLRGTSIARTPPASLATAGVTWSETCGSINNQDRALLRYTRSDDAAGLAYWNGESLVVVADLSNALGGESYDTLFPAEPLGIRPSLDRTGTIAQRPELDHPGRSGQLNDRDQVVFRVGNRGADDETNTDDDVQAVFVAQGVQ